MQTLTAQINLALMAPAQLVVFIEKQAGECVTPSPSEERNWSQKGPAPCVCALVVKGQSISPRIINLVLLCFELKFLKLWLNRKRLALVVRALAVKGQSVLLKT